MRLFRVAAPPRMSEPGGQGTGWLNMVLRLAVAVTVLTMLLTVGASALAEALPGAGVLALESDRGGEWDIYLLDVATSRLFNLTRLPGDEHAPAWSPDGARLAFSADRDGDGRAELYVIDADGLNLRTLDVGDGHNWRPVWSPDGQTLAFIRGFGLLLTVDLATNTERNVGEGFGPAWSPDGRYLVSYLDPNGRLNADLFLIDVANGSAHNITATPLNEWSPAWSPDGATIAFSSARDSSHSEIYLVDAACTQTASRTSACRSAMRRLTYNEINDTAPAWSADSRLLAVVVDHGGRFSVQVVDVATGEARLLVGGDGNYQHPAWKP